ncbi:MAG: threonine--tRNA ligase [Rhodospirillaceae bacterium]|nr:threonine--tRNA ligase [Rhodospirillaceae bacterium]
MTEALAEPGVSIRLPDGSERHYAQPVGGADVAASISKSLSKAAIAVKIDGALRDLTTPVPNGATVEIITRDSAEALEMIRHDAAHVMAEAVQTLFPGTQVTIGPPIENGFYYDFSRPEAFSAEDLAAIEAKMREIVKRGEPFVREVWDRNEAIDYFEKAGERYKAEIIRDLPESETITVYRQGGWLDLCRGPHQPTTGHVGQAFKLMKVAGAYWRGDSKNEMLQRIYGTAWRSDKELKDYLEQLEEAERRDHRRLGREMDLFHFQEEAPGQPFWHDKGWTIYTALLDFMRRKIRRKGYTEVNTPQLLDSTFWHQSGHWDKYRDNMFILQREEAHDAALKPMSCPGAAQLYRHTVHSYRDLPIRMAEFGKVFRREASGARHGLMRVQSFTQDDAHIFCTDEQLEDEVVGMAELIEEVYADLGFTDVMVKFATRPDQRIGADADWDRAEAVLHKACQRISLNWEMNPGDGAFYAPKLDFYLRDAIGRSWQCGTIQVDMNMPHRLGLAYVDEAGERRTPNMVHRAILGSVERFMGVMLEHYSGRLPLWLAPVQAVVATITNEADPYAEEVAALLRAKGLRVEADLRNEKINYKVREHSVARIPLLVVVGKREAEERTVALRRLGGSAQEILALDAAILTLVEEAAEPDQGIAASSSDPTH